MKTIALNGRWQFRQLGTEAWREGQVPGSLLGDLAAAGEGIFADPYWRDNEDRILPMFDHDYEYSRTFALSASESAMPDLTLRFEGLDTLAEVEVNGVRVLQADNMFRTYEIPVDGVVREGDNTIRVVFRSPVAYMTAKQAEEPLFGIPMVVQGYTHLRKAHYMSGWDWGPKLPDCGIWRGVSLLCHSKASLSDVRIRQNHRGGRVQLTVELETDGASVRVGQEAAAVVTLTAPDGSATVHRTSLASGSASMAIGVEEPQLWWPNGFGEQPLYQVAVRLTDSMEATLDERSYMIGLRELTVNTDKDEWGGGFYPDSYFYELCDKYGLIVWQDFMFACGVYPLNEAFMANAMREIEDNVKRIRHHASLGLLCGNNEIEMFFEDGRIANTEENRSAYRLFFEQMLPETAMALAPDTFYWPGSPSSGGDFFETNGENHGDGHYWDVWQLLRSCESAHNADLANREVLLLAAITD